RPCPPCSCPARDTTGCATTKRCSAPTAGRARTSSICEGSTEIKGASSLFAPTSMSPTYSRWTPLMHSPVSSTTSCSRQRRLNPGDRLACPTEKTSVCAGNRIEPGRLHRFACKGGDRLALQQKVPLFDYLVGAHQRRGRD